VSIPTVTALVGSVMVVIAISFTLVGGDGTHPPGTADKTAMGA
jgi:hypothetical protein